MVWGVLLASKTGLAPSGMVRDRLAEQSWCTMSGRFQYTSSNDFINFNADTRPIRMICLMPVALQFRLAVAAWSIVGRMVSKPYHCIRLPWGGHTYHQCFWLIKLQTVWPDCREFRRTFWVLSTARKIQASCSMIQRIASGFTQFATARASMPVCQTQ